MNLDDTGAFALSRTGSPVLRAEDLEARRPSSRHLKRPFDLVAAGLLLLVLAPVLLVAMLLVRLTSRGPALFVQERIGHRCRRFSMLKLRTMVDGAEHRQAELEARLGGKTFFKLEDDPRITRVGRLLRRYSIDEIPQLLNVLRGEMSLVGPRPLLPGDFEKFPRSRQMRRFAVKPGLTGLWQVSGRSLLDDADRLALDAEYVDRWSLALDCRILLRTIPAVLSGRGAT